MSLFTLDSLREEAVRRFAPTEVDLGDGTVVELKSLLRLGEKDRKAVIVAIDSLSELEYDDEDDEAIGLWSDLVVETCSKVFKLVASSPKKLIAALEEDDPVVKASLYTSVLTSWINSSQLGEAKPSPA